MNSLMFLVLYRKAVCGSALLKIMAEEGRPRRARVASRGRV
jgi:hypothetical protein